VEGLSERYVLKEGLFAAWSTGELVLLDTHQDRYIGLDAIASRVLATALGYRPSAPGDAHGDMRHEDTLRLMRWFLSNDFVRASGATKSAIASPREEGGLSVCEWQPTHGELTAPGTGTLMLTAWLTLLEVVIRLRYSDFHSFLQWLRRSRRCRTPLLRQEAVPGELNYAHLNARCWFPVRCNCLTSSAALAVHAWRKGIPVTFCIGVQKFPFYAHAWAENGNRVLNDAQQVRDRLAPIVTIG